MIVTSRLENMTDSLSHEAPVYVLKGTQDDSLSASLPSQAFDVSRSQLSQSVPEPSTYQTSDHVSEKGDASFRRFPPKRKFARLVANEAGPLQTKRTRIIESHSEEAPSKPKKPTKPKSEGRVKPAYGESSKRITEFTGPLKSTNKSVATESEQGKWPLTLLLRRSVLDRFLSECLGIDTKKALPDEIRIKSAQRLAWLEDRSKFSVDDLFLGIPMRTIKPDHFRDLFVMLLHMLTPTYAHPPRQTYKITFEEARDFGRFTCELLQLPPRAIKEPAFVHWASEQLRFAIEPHPTHKCAGLQCVRITWIWGEQAVVLDACRRLVCFFPPLAFGQECPIISVLRLIARPGDFRLSRAQEPLEDKLRELLKSGKERKFRPCGGVDGVHHSSGLLSTLYTHEL